MNAEIIPSRAPPAHAPQRPQLNADERNRDGPTFAQMLERGWTGAAPRADAAIAFESAPLIGRLDPPTVANTPTPTPPIVRDGRESEMNAQARLEPPIEGAPRLARPGRAFSGHVQRRPAYTSPHCGKSDDARTANASTNIAPGARVVGIESSAKGGSQSTRAPARTAQTAQSTPVAVAVHAEETEISVLARIGRLAPGERARLRQAINEVIAAYGYRCGDVAIIANEENIHG